MKNGRFFWTTYGGLLAIVLLLSAKPIPTEGGKTTKEKHPLVFVFNIDKEIAKPIWRTTQQAFAEAESLKADYIIIHLNTYGGRVDVADSIRTKILNSKIPVLVFIDNQAISAGSLISIAADSIYMRPGGSIGAATIVSQTGEALPDKYQSFMRSTMRATAEAHGKDTIIRGNDTILKWFRDPHIAESMVDPRIVVKGVIDSGKVLTLTADEAMKVGYCEGIAQNIPEVLKLAGIKNYELKEYKPTALEDIIGFLLSPVVHIILIILIIGGIYFELQTPGIGFPLAVAILAASLYFAPLYLEGLAQNWELVIFIVGVILIALEIFVIPGFGITGASGIILVITGLTLALVDNNIFKFDGLGAMDKVFKAFLLVIGSIAIAFLLSIYLSKKLFTSSIFKGFALEATQQLSEGYVSFDSHQKELIGKLGTAYTVLRPSGKVEIEKEIYDARSDIGFIEKGATVKVIRDEAGQLYVIKV
jgi:membrane-bound serine protease (ClpP class)